MNLNKTYIIAEMACSHEGKPEIAKKIIDGAGQAGADAIQFQVWNLAEMMVPHHPNYEEVKKLEISQKEWTELAGYVRKQHPDMHIVSCVYEENSVDLCQDIGVDAYKIHSADLSNPNLIKYVAETGKRIDLSIGASTIDEIRSAIECIRERSYSDIWLMYGYQSFPTPTDQIHLNYMKKLMRLFELPMGYQDHSAGDSEAGFWLPAMALGMGVGILEKHITHDRSLKGVDHEAALNPDEFKQFIQMVRILDIAKGFSVPKPFSEEELKYRKYSKKSLVAAHDISVGKKLHRKDFKAMRADELGLPPDQASRLIGKYVKRDISQFHLISEEDAS